MKLSIFILCFGMIALGGLCHASEEPVVSALSRTDPAETAIGSVTPEMVAFATRKARTKPDNNDYDDSMQDEDMKEGVTTADPFYPWNITMYHFNDALYSWLLKPAAVGYGYVVHEDFRALFGNFYRNVSSPVTIINNLLQLKVGKAATELVRFVINSTVGVAGLRDCAKDCFSINRAEEDFGQTLGFHGVGHGVYIIWPFFGPSSLRDTFGLIVDKFTHPATYINPLWVSTGFTVHNKINDYSFRIGDYESMKKAAIDPYVSMRDGYLQYRKSVVEK